MIIGLDTSCYTTSLAIIDSAERICLDKRSLLQVPPGAKGLRQSEAVFQHVKNLPGLLHRLAFEPIKIDAIAAAVRPRPAEDSYLPVFQVSASYGETLAQLLGVPLVKTSHQEGHIRAGVFNQNSLREGEFLAWHISGGTTELLRVNSMKTGYMIEKIGGSSDLQVGQFIDRVGVALGTGFPAGPQLEQLALMSNTVEVLPVVTKGLTVSFSGPASAAERLITDSRSAEKTNFGPDLARKVFNCISQALLRISIEAVKDLKIPRIILVGGVASSQIIRENLKNESLKNGIEFLFGPQELSSDNAVGVGLIGFDYLNRR